MLIDAHLHLWNTQLLHYEWLQRPENAVLAGTATLLRTGHHALDRDDNRLPVHIHHR